MDNNYQIIKLQIHPELKQEMARWFHEKWGIPLNAYLDSMDACLKNSSSVPQWYCVLDSEKIVGGLGIIENDFHDRKDLSPNVCAVYVEKAYRCQGIAGELLSFACCDMKKQGIDSLYLLTDHTSFYERYGWEFYCMAQQEGEKHSSRMYIHH